MSSAQEKTQFWMPPMHGLVGWRTLRVQTASSRYHVAFGPLDGRRVAVLRGQSHGRSVLETDGDARVGEASLFDVPSSEWIGLPLRVGAIVTSPVASVVPEVDPSVLAQVHDWARTGSYSALVPASAPAPAPSPRAAPPPAPAPASPLEGAAYYLALVEAAAMRLRHARVAPDLRESFANEPVLRERFGEALAECLLLVKALAATA